MNRRAIPAAVAATVPVPAVAQANPQRQIEELRALVLDLQAQLIAQEQWRAGVEAAWPNVEQ